jgi:hypothetical protein
MRTNLFTRLAPVAAVAMFAATASAQSIAANGVAASAETNNDRAPIFSGAAMVAPQSKLGFGVQAYTQRASVEESGVELKAALSAMQASAYYGVTQRLTVGAYVPFLSASAELTGSGAGDFDVSESGLGDAGVFGRFALMQSKSGMTHFALGAEATLPTGDEDKGLSAGEMQYRLDGALSHRVGKWNLHVVPGVEMETERDMGFNLNLAGVYSLNQNLGWSMEALSNFRGAPSEVDNAERGRDIDLASGLRYRMGTSALDFGLRYNVNSKDADPKPTVLGAYVGWNLQF